MAPQRTKDHYYYALSLFLLASEAKAAVRTADSLKTPRATAAPTPPPSAAAAAACPDLLLLSPGPNDTSRSRLTA